MTKANACLGQYRDIWSRKPALRIVYEDCYRRIAAASVPGTTLEIGGGSGNLKMFTPRIISIDILTAPWLDAVADAQRLPFADSSFDNIVMFDVLHHIENPCFFFEEAIRILRSGGRVIFVEPAITPLSWLFYKLFHPEPVRMSQNPLTYVTPNAARDPYDANQAIPTLLFGRYRSAFEQTFPNLRVRSIQLLSLFAYPLSGGFRTWSLLPAKLGRMILRVEDVLLPVLGKLMAFRMLAVVQRQ
jgi:SAM-dependent methyltransferase